MHRYARTFLIIFATALGGFAGLNILVDPYDVIGAPHIAGLTANKTHIRDDGGRINAADRMARGTSTSFLLGSSRTVDGFAHPPDNWPGGIANAGMRGTNAFELARAMTLAARDPDLRCLVIGLDMDEFGTHGKSKPSFPISALSDGNRWMALARMAMSPNTFAASLQTLADNLTGRGEETPWADIYEPGVQRGRYEGGARGIYSYYLGYRYDEERLRYFEAALDAVTERGVQVVAFIHPLHAWREEALFRSGRSDQYFALRADLAELFDRYADRVPVQACIEGGAAPLWDFSGFESVSTIAAPDSDQTVAHPAFYEPSHYLPHIGQAMLDRMRGDDLEGEVFEDGFGAVLTSDTVESSAQAIRARRDTWLQTEDGQAATLFLDAVTASDPNPEAAPPKFLNRDDWQDLTRALERLPDRAAPR